MFARTSTFQVPVDQIDNLVREIESRKSQLEQLPGYVDGYWMFDRKTGNALVVTLFDSEQSLRDSEEMATRIRSAASGSIGGTNMPPFQYYEVGVKVPGRMRRAA